MECHRGVYYIIFGFVLFRLLKLTAESTLKYAAITLMLFMISANALTNYIIFRARNLRLSFIIGLLFPAMDVALFVCLIQLNGIVTWALVPYLVPSLRCMVGLRSVEAKQDAATELRSGHASTTSTN